MKTVELVRQSASIRSLIRRAGHDATTHDLEMLGHWGRYICVLSSGFVENIVRNVYGAYVDKTTKNQQLARYTKRQLDSVQNPKSSRLVEIARSFDESWARDLDLFLQGNFRADAVNSIMANRHLIAHGRNSQITISRVDQYFSRTVEIADFLEAQCQI